jgi:hypothetical protein
MFKYKRKYLLCILITILVFLQIRCLLWAQTSRCREGGASGTTYFSETDAAGNITYYLAIGKAEPKSKHLCQNKDFHCVYHDNRPTSPSIGDTGWIRNPLEFGQSCKKCEKKSTCNECGMYSKSSRRYGSTTAACETLTYYEYKNGLLGIQKWVKIKTEYNYIHSLGWNCY